MAKTKFDIDNKSQWCPGCGNFAILSAMKNAFVSLDLEQTNHDKADYEKALQLAHMNEESIPTGIIYQAQGISFHERLDVLKNKPLFDCGFAKSQMNDILSQV